MDQALVKTDFKLKYQGFSVVEKVNLYEIVFKCPTLLVHSSSASVKGSMTIESLIISILMRMMNHFQFLTIRLWTPLQFGTDHI